MTPLSRAAPPAESTHPCVRCGRPVPVDVALCEYCNPLGLPQPASSQVHGSVFLAIGLAVVGLALLGRFALSGIGPFSGRIAGVVAAPPGLAVTVSVTNEGRNAGSATCRLYDPAQGSGVGPDSVYMTSPQVQPGDTVSFSQQVTELGGDVRPLAVICTGP